MTKILTILSLLFYINTFGQEVNYEMKAIAYFINKIESDTIFHQACDCVHYEYDTQKTLTIFDSSYLKIAPKMALNAFHFQWLDSIQWSTLNSEKVQIQNNVKSNRIKLTNYALDFNPNHYLIRFSDRLKYNHWTIIEFNIKSKKRCTRINYYFLFNEKGQIENHKMTIYCDSPG